MPITITPQELPKVPFEGYYRLSDNDETEFLHNEPLDDNILADPVRYIEEGELYDPAAKMSYKIRSIEGMYHILRYDLSHLNEKDYSVKQNRVEGKDFMSEWVESWVTEGSNKLLDGELKFLAAMPMLTPAWIAFRGFVPNQ